MTIKVPLEVGLQMSLFILVIVSQCMNGLHEGLMTHLKDLNSFAVSSNGNKLDHAIYIWSSQFSGTNATSLISRLDLRLKSVPFLRVIYFSSYDYGDNSINICTIYSAPSVVQMLPTCILLIGLCFCKQKKKGKYFL